MSAPAAPAAPAAAAPVQERTNALMVLVNRLKEYSGNAFKQRKPWTEVVDRSAFSKPSNFSEALTRVKKNASYFKVNYLIVMLASCVVTFVLHPSSLFVLGLLLGAWIYLLFIRQTPVVIAGKQLSEREKLLGMAAISFITIFFLTNVGAVFFSALSFSAAVIVAHGAFREPDNLFVDEVESQQSLLGILTGSGTTNTAATTVASIV